MLRHTLLETFSCIGDQCEDTCCKSWSMQVDEPTRKRYETDAPELVPDVEYEADGGGWIMRKDKQTGFCVRFENGLCGVHQKYGDTMLGDACHFYPRVTRTLGDQTIMSATLSCPEVARKSLFADHPSVMSETETGRVPNSIKDYLPQDISPQDALSVHQAFLEMACNTTKDAEDNMALIAMTSRSLATMPAKNWALMISFYQKDAQDRMPEPQYNINNPFNLLHTICGLIIASHKAPSERLQKTVIEMQTALAATLNWQDVTIETSGDESIKGLESLTALWETEGKALYNPILRRWLHVQISMGLHPFAGFGVSLTDKVTLMGMRMAIMKLALLSAHKAKGAALEQDDTVRVIQSLSRLLDHLADPAFSTQICNDAGWSNQSALRGVLALK